MNATHYRGRLLAMTTIAVAIAACTTVPPPVASPVVAPAPAPVIIIQPVKAEPLPVVVQAPPEPAKINEEAEEALAILNDLQKLILASTDEQKRELNLAAQSMARQRSDLARLRLGVLQSLPANGSDENRAIVTLEPLLKGAPSPVRAAAIVILAQLGERQRSLREEKKRSEDLQQKLDALKALERSLLGRKP